MKGTKNEMEIFFDAVSWNESFARVSVAAFVTHLNPTLEELADVKTAVSEAVTNAIIHGYENFEGYARNGAEDVYAGIACSEAAQREGQQKAQAESAQQADAREAAAQGTQAESVQQADAQETMRPEIQADSARGGLGRCKVNQGKVRLRCILDGDVLHIEVEDKGKGIENIERAMEPLFTTRPELDRSGMGFAFMEAFMDDLEVESAVGKGTIIRMTKKLGSSAWIDCGE